MCGIEREVEEDMASDYFTTTPDIKAPIEVATAAGNYTSYQVHVELEASAGHYQQKEQEDASNYKEQESVVNDQSLQDDYQKVESVTEGEVLYGQQEEPFTQVESGNVKRDYGQRGSYQNQRGRQGLEEVVVDTRMGGMNLMMSPVEMVTKGTTTTTEEGDVVVVEEMGIHTTTTKTLMLLLHLSFCTSVVLGASKQSQQ